MKNLLRVGSVVSAIVLLQACVPVVVGGAALGALTVAQDRSSGEALTDAEIKLRINSALIEADDVSYAPISINVTEGRVVLLGAVANQQQKVRAGQVAIGVQDVREVINELIISNRTAGDIFRDTGRTASIRAQLLTAEDVMSINYSIETVNRVVHIMGLAQNAQELQRVTQIAAGTSGVERVVSHALLVNDPLRRRDNS